jgi:hypothetical protein
MEISSLNREFALLVFASFVIKAILKSFILPLANKYGFA